MGFDGPFSIQFDDEGKPIIGRAELIDTEEIIKQQFIDSLNEHLNETIDNTEGEGDSKNNNMTIIMIFKQLIMKVGTILPAISDETFEKMVRKAIEYIKEYVKTPAEYATYVKKLESEREKVSKRSILQYEKYATDRYIYLCAIILLFELQSNIPGYMIMANMRGKAPTLVGYPYIQPEEGESVDLSTINYFSNIILYSYYTSKKVGQETPIKLLVLPSISKEEQRYQHSKYVEHIEATLKKYTQSIYNSRADVKTAYDQKRIYVHKNKDTSMSFAELIPAFYLPPQSFEIDGAIVPEVGSIYNSNNNNGNNGGNNSGNNSNNNGNNGSVITLDNSGQAGGGSGGGGGNGNGGGGGGGNGNSNGNGNGGGNGITLNNNESFSALITNTANYEVIPQLTPVYNWMRIANKIAKEYVVNSDKLLQLSSCCTIPINFSANFLDEKIKDTVKLEPRVYLPTIVRMLQVHFRPRKHEELTGQIPEQLLYRLFAKYCETGDYHEFAPNYTCYNCGFSLPEHPSLVSMGKTKEEIQETTGKIKEEVSKIVPEINMPHYLKLLDKIHINSEIKITNPILPVNNLPELFKELAKLNIFDGWNEKMMELSSSFTGDISRLTRENISGIINDIANTSKEYKYSILKTLVESGENKSDIGLIKGIMTTKLEEKNKISWLLFFNILSAYFIVPMNRIQSGFTGKSLNLSDKLIKELSEIHGEQLRNLISTDMAFFTGTGTGTGGVTPTTIMKNTFAKYKISQFITGAQLALKLKNLIRPTMLPGGGLITQYLQLYIIYGLLSNMLDSNNVFSTGVSSTDLTSGKKMLCFIVKSCFYDFNNKYIDISDEKVKYIVQSIAEKEKRNEIKRIRDMTTEEKMADKEQRALGIGYYARMTGVWRYDADYYDREQGKGLHDAHEGSTQFESFGRGKPAITRGTGIYDQFSGGGGAGDGGYDITDSSRADE
jgi:uncharacterized membrane protein YgcG